jgi:hypothetical protein
MIEIKHPRDLAGIAIYSEDLNEIETSVESCLSTTDEYMFAQCALAFEQMAMRFGKIKKPLFDEFNLQARRFMGSKVVAGALQAMDEDLRHFKPIMID